MAKRKKKKRAIKKTAFFTMVSLGIIISLSYVFTSYFMEIYKIYKEKKDLTKEIAKLEEEEEKLESDVQKLQDPEYVARYAREKYLYSKDGEFIIKLP